MMVCRSDRIAEDPAIERTIESYDECGNTPKQLRDTIESYDFYLEGNAGVKKQVSLSVSC